MKTIPITTSALRDVLPCLEAKLERLTGDRDSLSYEVEALEKSIAEIKTKLSSVDVVAASNGTGGDRKRLPKGHGDELIENILRSQTGGNALTMAEIKAKTGVNHSTIFRTLTDPKRNKGRFVVDGNKWKLKR